MTRGNNHNVFSMASLDMSLDEIQSASASNRGDGRNRNRGMGRGRGSRGIRGFRGNRGRNDGGRQMRGRGRGGSGGRGRGRGTGNIINRDSNYQRATNLSIRGQSFKRGSTFSRRGTGPGIASGRGRGRGGGSGSGIVRNPPSIETTGKVIVRNLGSHVTSDDVKEIFEKIGTITQAFVKFDKNGKSTGTAEVVYAKKDDARKAQRDLNGAHVDGVAINVALSSQSPSMFHNSSSSSSSSRGGRSQFPGRMNNVSRSNRDNNNYNFNNQGHHPLDRLYNK